MGDNKKAREELIKYYGAECFIEKLKLRRDTHPRIYKSKRQMRKMKQLTYHHIKMKKNGGESSVENGALLSVENHQWFHEQNEHAQGYMNAIFQEYKKQVDACRVVFVDNVDVPFEIAPVVFHVDEKGSIHPTSKTPKKSHKDKHRKNTKSEQNKTH